MGILSDETRAEPGATEKTGRTGVSELMRSAKAMISRIILLMLASVFCSCSFQSPEFIDPSDPELTSKLGITQEDWLAIQLLCSARSEYVIKDVGKVSQDLVEVEFKDPRDTRGDQGGPADRYEKKQGTWQKVPYMQGSWAVGYVPSKE